MKKKNIVTNNKEVYNKLNMLNFTSHILLENVKLDDKRFQRLLSNINKPIKVVSASTAGEFVVVKKLKDLNLNVYLQKKKKIENIYKKG